MKSYSYDEAQARIRYTKERAALVKNFNSEAKKAHRAEIRCLKAVAARGSRLEATANDR